MSLNVEELKRLIVEDIKEMGFRFSLPEFIDNNIRKGKFKGVKDKGHFLLENNLVILDNSKDEQDERHWLENGNDKFKRKSIGFAILENKNVHCFDIIIGNNKSEIINELSISTSIQKSFSGINYFYYLPTEKNVIFKAEQDVFKDGLLLNNSNILEKSFNFYA